MSAQHTPGPWAFLPDEARPWVGTVYDVSSEQPVCSLSAPVGIINARGHLISASPDLLWFAQQLFNGIDTGMIKLDTVADETLATVLRKGRAAIAKAEGRA